MTGTGHIPRDHWPEPEHPVYPDLTRPLDLPLRDRIAARFWDAMQGLEMVLALVRRVWERWRDPRPFGRGRR